MLKKIILGLSLVCIVAVSGCATTGKGKNEQSGEIIGAILGGVLGSQVGKGDGRTAAIIIGTMAGAMIGGNVGKSMDETDQLKTTESLETVRTGEPTSWNNPDTGNEYTVTPTRTYEQSSMPCREYTIDANIDGKKEKVYGTACRQPDGSWQNQG